MRAVTEDDFRQPQYRGEKPEDYEFNANNIPVRKDRWYTAIQEIRCMVGVNGRAYEISDVIDAIKELTAREAHWMDWTEHSPDPGSVGEYVDIKLFNGSILMLAVITPTGFQWNGMDFDNKVEFWREYPPE